MTYALIVDPAAESDLARAGDYYERIDPDLELRFRRMIRESFEKIQSSPLAFPHISQGVRFVRPRRFPYVVYYRVEGTQVVVFAVLHKAQSSSTWERRL